MQCIMIASSNISHDQSDRWCLLIALVQKDQFFVYYIGQLQSYNTADSDSAQAIITCAPAAKVSLFLFVLFCVMATPVIPQCKRVRCDPMVAPSAVFVQISKILPLECGTAGCASMMCDRI